MTLKPKVFDKRGLIGVLSRGKNIYPAGSPNPVGKNQHKNIQEAARRRLRGNGKPLY